MSMKYSLDSKKGLVYGILGGVLWGLFPLFYWPLQKINAWEIVCYRIIFSNIFLIGIVLTTYRRAQFFVLLKTIFWRYVFCVSCILGVWWFTFAYGVTHNYVTDLALGYFLSPIMSAFVATMILKEKVSFLSKSALFFCIIGVSMLIVSDLHKLTFPWIACVVGSCYSLCAILKKHTPGESITLHFLEVSILLPVALCLLYFLHLTNHLVNVWSQGFKISFFVIGLGVSSVSAFGLFSIASKNLSLLASAFLQFIPPTLGFIFGVTVFHEQLSWVKMIVFLLIWIGVVLFLSDVILQHRRSYLVMYDEII